MIGPAFSLTNLYPSRLMGSCPRKRSLKISSDILRKKCTARFFIVDLTHLLHSPQPPLSSMTHTQMNLFWCTSKQATIWDFHSPRHIATNCSKSLQYDQWNSWMHECNVHISRNKQTNAVEVACKCDLCNFCTSFAIFHVKVKFFLPKFMRGSEILYYFFCFLCANFDPMLK